LSITTKNVYICIYTYIHLGRVAQSV
jgi:hypothetical protein